MSDALINYLTHITGHFKPPMCPLERLVLERGKDYIAQKRPQGIHKQKDKLCYKHATDMALRDPAVEYVEGYAVHGDLGIPILHAWCVTKDDKVIDPTWRWPEKSRYRGVVIPRDLLLKAILKTKTYGVLDGGGMLNFEIIEHLQKGVKPC